MSSCAPPNIGGPNGTCASDAPSFHALAGLGARLLVSAGGTAVALLPLVRQFRSFLWREPGPFGTTRADRNPSHVPHDPLLNAHVLKGCDGRCLHGFVPLINLCCLRVRQARRCRATQPRGASPPRNQPGRSTALLPARCAVDQRVRAGHRDSPRISVFGHVARCLWQ